MNMQCYFATYIRQAKVHLKGVTFKWDAAYLLLIQSAAVWSNKHGQINIVQQAWSNEQANKQTPVMCRKGAAQFSKCSKSNITG